MGEPSWNPKATFPDSRLWVGTGASSLWSMTQMLLLMLSGFTAGAMNALAGGGSFVTLPALVWAGVPSVAANASSTVALFPGGLSSAWAYREDLTGFGGVSLGPLLAVSLFGGFAGALLLLLTPQATFDRVLPWLLLLATLAFVFGRRAGMVLRRVVRIGAAPVLVAQFLLALYGGYFGGAVGIMMMALWSMLSPADLKALNPAKTVLVGATNAIAVVCFVVAGRVWWTETVAMMLSGVVGGYLGARLGRRLPPQHLRAGFMLVSVLMTVAFFLRAS